MIFITIGTQGPFDRLIKVLDAIAPQFNEPFIAQVSESSYKVRNMQSFVFVSPKEFDNYFTQARLVISHAGMGTIISALVQQKPILVMPRLAQYGEQRNDHQLATAKVFEKLNYINVAYNEGELKNKLANLLKEDLKPLHQIGEHASAQLINSLKHSIAV